MIGLLIIGDEILSAHVEDKNLKYMLRNLAIAGYKVTEARLVPDDLELISSALKALSESNDFVITSGGVGPTHDDLTLEATAKAFGDELYTNEKLVQILREHISETLSEDALRMARIPKNSEVIHQDDDWPMLKVENCYILPGVPEIFERKFDRVLQLLPQVDKYFQALIYTKTDELGFAEKLREMQGRFPDVMIGSYPVLNQADYKTQITMKTRDKSRLSEVFDALKLYFLQSKSLYKVVEPSFYNPK